YLLAIHTLLFPYSHDLPSTFLPTIRLPPRPTSFPYTTLFRSKDILRGQVPDAWNQELDAYENQLALKRMGRLEDKVFAETRLRRSEEHTSELQSRENLVFRLLLEKKRKSRCPSPISPTRSNHI